MTGKRNTFAVLAEPMPALTPLDLFMLDPAKTGKALATRWRELLDAPRYRLLNAMDAYAGLLVALEPPRQNAPTTPEERLLRAIHGPCQILAVRAYDRRAVRIEPASRETGPMESALCSCNIDTIRDVARHAREWPAHGWVKPSAEPFRGFTKYFIDASLALVEQAQLPESLRVRAGRLAAVRERALARDACAHLLALLDRRVLRDMTRYRVPRRFETYNWIGAAPDGTRRLRRLQAAFSYPLFAVPMTNNNDRSPQLAQAVDDGAPLVTALATHYGVPPALIRRLRKPNSRALLAGNDAYRLHHIVPMLAEVPLEKLPNTTADWRCLLAISDDLSVLQRTFTGSDERVVADLAGLICGYVGRLVRAGWRPARQRHFSLYHTTAGAFDFLDVYRLIERVIMGDTETRDITDSGWEALTTVELHLISLGFEKLVAVSESWHEALYHPAALALESGETLSWPPLVQPVTLNKRCIIALTNSDDLQNEGHSLRHCVGTYAVRCFLGPVHVLSIRDEAGRPRSTMELQLHNGPQGLRPRLVQHRARRNRRPGKLCRDAALALMAQLESNSAGLGADFAVLDHARGLRVASHASQRAGTGREISPREHYALERALPPEISVLLFHGIGDGRIIPGQ